MIKYLLSVAACLFSLQLFAGCCIDSTDSFEIGLGWRKDDLKWKTRQGYRGFVDADSEIHFKNLNFYEAYAKVHSIGCAHYARAQADYAITYKGRCREHFHLDAPYFGVDELSAISHERIKRRSECFDFNGAVGYPFMFRSCRLMVSPLIGFSFHRQRLRSKARSRYWDSSFIYAQDSSSDPSSFEGSSKFSVNSLNPFGFGGSSDPFATSPSNEIIAEALGLSIEKRTSVYRFTWYGFYLGVDIAYALDSCWTLFSQTEYHCYDRCHRKRKSLTGVQVVDRFHHSTKAYGLDQSIGLTYEMGCNYYLSIETNMKWWKSDSKYDRLQWRTVSITSGLGYFY